MTYHVLIEGEQKGPYEASSVARMIEHGEIDQATLVWTVGMADWQPAESVPELAAPIAGPPVPPPPLTAGPPPEPTTETPLAMEPLPASGGRLAIGATFGQAFAAFTHQPFRALILMFFYIVILVAISVGAMFSFAGSEILKAGANLGAGLVELPLDQFLIIFGVIMIATIAFSGGLVGVLTEMIYQRPARIRHLFVGFPRILPLFFGIIFYAVMVSAGFALLILPGIFLLSAMMLWPFFVVDSRLGPATSLGASYRGVLQLGWWRVFFAFLVTIGTMFVLISIVSLIGGAGMAAIMAELIGGNEKPADMMKILIAMTPMLTLTILTILLMNLGFGLIMASIYAQTKAGEE